MSNLQFSTLQLKQLRGIPGQIILFVLFGWLIYPIGVELNTGMSLSEAWRLPGLDFPMGTDAMGRDLLYRYHQVLTETVLPLWGSLGIAFGISFVVAFLLTSLCEKSKVWNRLIWLIQGVFHIAAGIPLTVLVLFLAVWFGKMSGGILFLLFAAFAGLDLLVLQMGLYFRDRGLEYWQAHKSLGGGFFSRYFRYGIKTNWSREILARMIHLMKICLVTEASLSYLGFGMVEPAPSFGNILSNHLGEFFRGQYAPVLMTVVIMTLVLMVPSCCLEFFRSLSKLGNRFNKKDSIRVES